MTSELMTIGDFAREAGLTPKALRLYDELGLVTPAEVDAYSGYRRYAVGQLDQARLVASLRLIGMPLARIRTILAVPRAAAAREVEAYWRQVEHDTATRRDMVSVLVDRLRNEGSEMTNHTNTLHAEIGTHHGKGSRERQQDALLTTPGLIAIADGYGERDDLSRIALEAFADGGVVAAAGAVAAEAPSSGTTLTAVAIEDGTARITHLGDGRVWLVRAGVVDQVTYDHTVVAGLIEAGQLTLEEARSHPHRNLLNRSLVPGVAPDEVEIEVRAGDRLVLTTDGVHTVADDLAALLAAASSPQEVADAVAAAVVAAGEPDNYTVIVADLA